MVIKSCDTSVDKVALIARWLVIHTRKRQIFKYTKYVFVVFIVKREQPKLGDYAVGMGGSRTRND